MFESVSFLKRACLKGLLSCLLLFTASCGGMYKNPPQNAGKTALLYSSSDRDGLYTWQNNTVEAVDNKPINYAASWSTTTKKIVVNQGKHDVVVSSTFGRGFGNGPFEARCDINMDFKPSMEYQANGRIEGSQVAMWIEDYKTSKPVSKIVRIPYGRMATTTTVPIFIPVN